MTDPYRDSMTTSLAPKVIHRGETVSLPTKPLVTSFGFWGSVVAIVSFGFAWLVRTGKLPAEIEEPVRSLSLDLIAGAIGGVLALYGRWVAHQPLGLTAERSKAVMKSILLPLLLLPLLAGGCVNAKPADPNSTGTVQPASDQLAFEELIFEIGAAGVESWADFSNIPPATNQRIHAAVDRARQLVSDLKADYAAGRADLLSVVRRIRQAATDLARNRIAVVQTDPRARQPRALAPATP